MNAHPEALDDLIARVEALEKRVAGLEHQAHTEAIPIAKPMAAAQAIAQPLEPLLLSGVFSVIGSALLGIAGAYLLRALSGTSLVQRRIVAGLAVAYAVGWLVAAARAVHRRQFAGILFAATSVLILAPMLWEMSLRFHAMPAGVAAVVLAGYTAMVTGLTWHFGRTHVLSVGYAGAAASALALLVGTHDMAPFAIVLLVMVAAGEYLAIRGVGLSARPLVALVCNAGIWSVLFIYRIPESGRSDYPALGWPVVMAIGCALFILWTCGIAIRVLWLRRRMTAFDVLQAIISFLLASIALEWFMPDAGSAVLGACCIVLSVSCYLAAFGPLRQSEYPRNFHVFAIWGAALLVAGVFLCAPGSVATALFAIAGLGATLAGRRIASRTLTCQGLAYLVLAAAAAGLHVYVFDALTGKMPARPAWDLFVVIACALLLYALTRERPDEGWPEQAIHLVAATVAASSAMAILASAFFRLASMAFEPDVFHVAFIRTITICSTAIGLALGGSRWSRPAMTRVAYAAMALVAAKLLFEDLRHGRMEYIAASICLVALTLIAVPRITHRQHRA